MEEKEIRPSHLPRDPHWLEVKTKYPTSEGEKVLNVAKYFVSDLDQIEPDKLLQNTKIKFRDFGIDEATVKALKTMGAARRVWLVKQPDGSWQERTLRFEFRLIAFKKQHADMLRAKDV